MRDIKFRGKTGTTKGKKWVYGYYYKVKSFFDNEVAHFIGVIRNNHLTDFNIDENTLGQYTGLHDRNGKEIYEGDIVKIRDELCIVKYNYNEFGLKVIDKTKPYGWISFITYNCEVIGNIYENSDLLKD